MAPSEMTVPADQLDKEFFDLAEAEGVTDIEELNKVLDRAVGLRTFLTADDRVEKVAAFVAEHFKENVLPAPLQGVPGRRRPRGLRQIQARARQAACRRNGRRPSTPRTPPTSIDRPLVAELQLSETREEDVRLLFKKPAEDPKILIVTDKLLTGYDAPLLYCMYLDKPMRDHVLLQAIARVNRPYVDEEGIQKRVGLVVDFVGVLRELKKALQFDSSDVERRDRGPRPADAGFSGEDRRRPRTDYLEAGEGGDADERLENGRLWAVPRPGTAQGVLRSLQGYRGALGDPVAVAGAARPHRDLQAPGPALCRRAQCLCRQGRLHRRPCLQDAAAGRGERRRRTAWAA